MIERGHDLPLGRQAELVGLSRSTLYYEPRPVPASELAIMRRIDALHLDYPFAGSRMLRDLLRGEGVMIGRELVATMMRRMGIEAIYRKPNTSKAALGHRIYPYLLRGLAIERPNQAWAMDITLSRRRNVWRRSSPSSTFETLPSTFRIVRSPTLNSRIRNRLEDVLEPSASRYVAEPSRSALSIAAEVSQRVLNS